MRIAGLRTNDETHVKGMQSHEYSKPDPDSNVAGNTADVWGAIRKATIFRMKLKFKQLVLPPVFQ